MEQTRETLTAERKILMTRMSAMFNNGTALKQQGQKPLSALFAAVDLIDEQLKALA